MVLGPLLPLLNFMIRLPELFQRRASWQLHGGDMKRLGCRMVMS